MTNSLEHHGILGQVHGVRNGPPYPLKGGDYTEAERKAISNQRHKGNSIYNKKHFDEVIKADKATLTTLSYDRNRLKNADYFYAAYRTLDKHQYNALFNRPIPRELFDENGNSLGTGTFCKYKIDSKLAKDLKVASEDSAAEIFTSLYSKDRDFYNFVTDEKRMRSYFVSSKYKFKGYREARDVLQRMSNDPSYKPTSSDLQTVYRMFNYVIPYDGAGNARAAHDAAVQRAKFFKACKQAGYGAVLDTNDAIYGAFKARSPVIVFDMEDIIPDSVKLTDARSKALSKTALAGRRMLGI